MRKSINLIFFWQHISDRRRGVFGVSLSEIVFLSFTLSTRQVSSDSVNRTFTALIICEKGNEEGEGNGPDATALPHFFNTALFIPEG